MCLIVLYLSCGVRISSTPCAFVPPYIYIYIHQLTYPPTNPPTNLSQKCSFFSWADSHWGRDSDVQHTKQAAYVQWERFDSSTGYKLCGGSGGDLSSLKFRAEAILQVGVCVCECVCHIAGR